MKVLLDIKDSKADFVMELLNSLSFVKTSPVKEYDGQLKKELQQAVEEVKQIKAGKKKGRNAEDFLREL